MNSGKIAIVCDGREISFGLNLLHLFQYKDNEVELISSLYDDLSIDLYSVAAFGHEQISPKTFRIYIDRAQKPDASFEEVFNRFGMRIYRSGPGYLLKADRVSLREDEYEEFIAFANQKREEYLACEKDYVKQVEDMDMSWIAGEFGRESSGKWSGKPDVRTRQRYDCLAFVLYLDFLRNESI